MRRASAVIFFSLLLSLAFLPGLFPGVRLRRLFPGFSRIDSLSETGARGEIVDVIHSLLHAKSPFLHFSLSLSLSLSLSEIHVRNVVLLFTL